MNLFDRCIVSEIRNTANRKWHDNIVKRINFKYTRYALYTSKILQNVTGVLVGTRYWLHLQNQ